MVAFYKHHIPAWMDGTEELSDGAYRVYHVVCQLIYLHEAPVSLNERGIAGRCRQSIRAFRANLKELLEAGKLTLQNGRLANSRAIHELEKISENRDNASKGGKKSGEVRKPTTKSLKNNDASEAPLQTEESLKEKNREDKTREKEEVGSDDPTPSLFSDREAGLPKKHRKSGASPSYTPEFEDGFWKSYPRTPTMSKSEAFEIWDKLSAEDRARATAAVPQFVSFLRKQGAQYPVVHACRFLSQRRFEGFAESTPKSATPAAPVVKRKHGDVVETERGTRVWLKQHSTEWEQWGIYLRSEKRQILPLPDVDGGRPFPSRWPPGREPTADSTCDSIAA